MSNREYDYLFKLVIVGNSGVGKSSVLLRFADDQFSESYLTTIGVDFRFKTLTIDGKHVKLQIWDTAGQERFRTITNAYYKGADGYISSQINPSIVVVYDTTCQKSFEDIEKFWFNEIESYADKDVNVLMLGNKSDMDDKKQVSTEKAQDYATARRLEFFETSAKTSEYVEQAFQTIAKKLMQKRDQQLNEKKDQRRKNRQSQKQGQSTSESKDSFEATDSNQSNQQSQRLSQPQKEEQKKKKEMEQCAC